MHSLKLPKERKPTRLLESSHMPLASPHGLKRSSSPKFAELQKAAMRQRVSSPKALKMSPLSPAKRRSFVAIPKSRQELISQYRHIQVFDFESVTPKRPARLSSYKLDAAELLTTSLKKHYNKFFFVWRKHARDLKKEQIRKETASTSIRLVLTPSRARMLTPDIERRMRSGTESKMSEKAVSLWSERLTTDPAVKRSSQPSPLYTEVTSERTFLNPKATVKTPTAEVSTQVPAPIVTTMSGDSDQQDEHLAMASNISHPDISGTSAAVTPESTGNMIRMVFTLSMLLQRRKQKAFARVKEADPFARYSPNPASIPENQSYPHSPKSNTFSEYSERTEKLTQVLAKVVLRPAWEQLRTETLRLIVAQLLAIGLHKLVGVYESALRAAFSALQSVPKASLLQRKPAISLKTTLNTLLTNRLQAAFNTTRHYVSLRKRREADLKTKLRYCFQVCDLARVRLLARYFNRLRHGDLFSLPVPKGDSRWRGSAVTLGLKVIDQILTQAKTRGLRESLHVVERYSSELARTMVQAKATLALSAPLSKAAERQWVELFHSFRQAKRTAVLIHKGKRKITRMIRRYFRETKAQLATSFFVWKTTQAAKENAPIGVTCPEVPLFGQILKRVLDRRVAWGVGRLKANYFGFDLSPSAPIGSKGAAMALAVLLGKAVAPLCSGVLDKLRETGETGTVSEKRATQAKRVATRLIFAWTAAQGRKNMHRRLMQWGRPERLSRGLAVISRLQQRRAVLQWRQIALSSKQRQRSVELLSASLRNKVGGFFDCFKDGRNSLELELERYSQEQKLGLRLALEKLNTNHAVVKCAALVHLNTQHPGAHAARQRVRAISAVLRLTRTIRPCVVFQQRTAFHSLILIP